MHESEASLDTFPLFISLLFNLAVTDTVRVIRVEDFMKNHTETLLSSSKDVKAS